MQFSAILALAGLSALSLAAPLEKRACAPLELLFARGTTEAQGLGLVGTPLAKALSSLVSGATSYAVVYPASADFVGSPPQGASDALKHMQETAASCPDTKFALGGYSQGAMVVHDVNVSAELKAKVVAVAVFGDPYRTLTSAGWPTSSTDNVYSTCAEGDPVCENGMNVMAHLSYTDKTTEAAQFIAQRAGA
ncbi:cutinase [Geopyxis carbonaria]|nr:cutinase [Geopyxis carbonaria]